MAIFAISPVHIPKQTILTIKYAKANYHCIEQLYTFF